MAKLTPLILCNIQNASYHCVQTAQPQLGIAQRCIFIYYRIWWFCLFSNLQNKTSRSFLLFGFTNRNRLQIFCPLNIRFYFFLHFFVCPFFFCFRNHFLNFFVRHAKRICQANSFCLICSQFIFDRTLIQSYNQFYNNIFHLRKNISTI